MKQRDYLLYLQDILDAIHDIGEFVQGLSYEQFLADKKTQNAVVRSLETIGEAAKSIPRSVRDQYPAIPWSDMARMRDKLSHGYWGIDYEIVWKVVQEKLPLVEKEVREALNKERERQIP